MQDSGRMALRPYNLAGVRNTPLRHSSLGASPGVRPRGGNRGKEPLWGTLGLPARGTHRRWVARPYSSLVTRQGEGKSIVPVSKTITCGDLTAADEGREVTLMGWLHRRRDHGHLIFIDLRDRFGITQ